MLTLSYVVYGALGGLSDAIHIVYIVCMKVGICATCMLFLLKPLIDKKKEKEAGLPNIFTTD